MELSERITLWRESRKGLTQAVLAKKIGISPSAVAQWELGQTTPTTDNLAKIAKAVSTQPGPLVVEGHTDDLPVRSPLFPSNWELSAARAARVVRFLVEEAGIDGARLSAVGLADTCPLVENVDAATREANRRVQIVIVTEGGER